MTDSPAVHGKLCREGEHSLGLTAPSEREAQSLRGELCLVSGCWCFAFLADLQSQVFINFSSESHW